MATLLADFGDSFWLPTRASSYAGGVDSVFNFIFWVSAFFFLLVVTLMVVFIIRYRGRRGRQTGRGAMHNTPLEVTWTVIPTVLVIIIFLLGHSAFVRMTVPPADTDTQIDVTASMWSWQFTYRPSGFESGELHLPLDVPVRLVLRSNDVIHGFYVPQFRIKKDVVPGRNNEVWVRATEAGTFDLYCTQYCGTQHSTMLAKVVVQEPGEFKRWIDEEKNREEKENPVEAGRRLYVRKTCANCHSVDGSALIGPSFKDLFGSKQTFTDGSTAVVDDAFVRRFVRSPQERVPVGFTPQMSAFTADALTEQQVDRIIAYLKTITVHYTPPPTTAPTMQQAATTQPAK